MSSRTLLEAAFPYDRVSQLVAADRRSPDPAYQAHRWWARRPPALVRAALIAATMPADAHPAILWEMFASPEAHLAEVTVLDPFMGGGATLIEASRLGAAVRGQDVDPMSVEINRHQLSPADANAVMQAGQYLVAYLEAQVGNLWPSTREKDDEWVPLHYFSLAKVTCPSCTHENLLYRSLVVARSVGKKGAVVRDAEVTSFCPSCLQLHSLASDAKTLTCCGKQRRLDDGTFRSGRYHCPSCTDRHSHEHLATGAAPRVTIAVEETPARGRRRIRSPLPTDTPIVDVVPCAQLNAAIEVHDNDRRPVSYGLTTIRDLYTPRQIVYLSKALDWIERNVACAAVARALRLAVSTSVTSNNRLCGYATDYGRLAPLFSVRAFSLPALTVELNPLHPKGGRGSLRAAISRVVDSCNDQVRRHVIRGENYEAKTLNLPRIGGVTVTLTDSTAQISPGHKADLCFTDPPYFDYIHYDTLSQVFRTWLPGRDLAGQPILPAGEDPSGHFGQLLGSALANTVKEIKADGITAFTFKGNEAAWQGVARALETARLRVTGLWPVLADPGMGHHSGSGNCEFDLLVVTRPEDSCEVLGKGPDVGTWLLRLEPIRPVTACDRKSFQVAISALTGRWGQLRANAG